MTYLPENLTEFYPEIEPFDSFMLAVGDGHELFVERSGNPNGQPVIFLHGGPGGGCGPNDRRFFDPEIYHIIIFDQRGCGRSLPHGSLEHNDTKALVADIEAIRVKLNIEKWHVFGGSWGSTLALVYAQAHPDQTLSLALRGIFLARPQNAHWLFGGGGASEIFPDHWQEYTNVLTQYTDEISIESAHKILVGDDKVAANAVAKAWTLWEINSCSLLPNPEFLEEVETDPAFCWTLARHEAHYMVNNCFLTPTQIIDDCAKIKHIPTVIVHGRYDIVCTLENAHTLMKHLDNAQLIISQTAGHASSEPETRHHLINATKKLAALF